MMPRRLARPWCRNEHVFAWMLIGIFAFGTWISMYLTKWPVALVLQLNFGTALVLQMLIIRLSCFTFVCHHSNLGIVHLFVLFLITFSYIIYAFFFQAENITGRSAGANALWCLVVVIIWMLFFTCSAVTAGAKWWEETQARWVKFLEAESPVLRLSADDLYFKLEGDTIQDTMCASAPQPGIRGRVDTGGKGGDEMKDLEKGWVY